MCGLDSDSDGFPDEDLDCSEPFCSKVLSYEYTYLYVCIIRNILLIRIFVLIYIVKLEVTKAIHFVLE